VNLVLYSRDECHLCEQAMALLAHLGLAAFVREVDIEADVDLLGRYCLRIPVLRDARGRELDWPFDLVGLQAFLEGGDDTPA